MAIRLEVVEVVRRSRVLFAALGVFALQLGASAQELLAITWEGTVVRVAPNAPPIVVGPSGFTDTNSLARSSTGRLITTSWTHVVELDPVTGQGTKLFDAPTHMAGLAFDDDDVLYASAIWGDRLYRVDLETETWTDVGFIGFNGVQGLAYRDGVLYGWDTIGTIGVGLVRIDPATAQGTNINPLIPGHGNVQALAFAPDGTLFGARLELFRMNAGTNRTIDLRAGAYVPVHSLQGFDVRGIEFVPSSR